MDEEEEVAVTEIQMMKVTMIVTLMAEAEITMGGWVTNGSLMIIWEQSVWRMIFMIKIAVLLLLKEDVEMDGNTDLVLHAIKVADGKQSLLFAHLVNQLEAGKVIVISMMIIVLTNALKMEKLILIAVQSQKTLGAKTLNINILLVIFATKEKLVHNINIQHSAENSQQIMTIQNAWKRDSMKKKEEEM